MRSTRRRTRRARHVGPVLAFALYGLIGCNEPLATPIPAAGSEAPQRGGTLRLASLGDIRNLDPAVSAEALASGADELLFAGLVDYDESSNIVPDLASRYEVSEDGLTYRFFLREGAHFHDGEEVTADDVKRSIERALHPSTPNPRSSLYEMILGYGDYTTNKAPHLEGVTVEGRYVVSIRLRERDARFLPLFALTSLRPVCKSAGERYSDNWLPCGAGPFRLEPGGWDRGRSLTLVRNDGYFRPGLPYLDAVSWTYSMNIVTERFKLEQGELDVVRDFSEVDLQRFRADPRWKPLGVYEPERTVEGVAMNTELPPFDNVEVRRAVAAAIDREHYRLVRPAILRVAYQAIPPAIPGYNPAFQGQRHDYEAALEHMRRAGYPYDPVTRRGGYGPTVTYYAYRQGLAEFTAQLLAQDLAKIGLRLEIKIVNFPTFLSLIGRKKTSQMAWAGWTEDYPDPADFFEPIFSASAINDEESQNWAFYNNPRFDEILDQARHELVPKKRYELYGEANHIVCDDAPWAFTDNYHFYIVHQGYVRDYRPHPVWSEYLAKTWIDRRPGALSSGGGLSWRALTGFVDRPDGRRP